MLASLALLPSAQAVDPPPDGGYPNWNTAEGTNALFTLTTGAYNTGLGGQALYSNTTGGRNTAVGLNALYRNTTGSWNTAIGTSALFSNTTGYYNTAVGGQTLANNTIGHDNTASGLNALYRNTTGVDNTANGAFTLFNNTSGNKNVSFGGSALYSNTTGRFNTALGVNSLYQNTTGSFNTALGIGAGFNNQTGNGNIYIDNPGGNLESNTMRIGDGIQRTFISGIRAAVISGLAVVINADGQLGLTASSARFKDEVKAMDKASEAILALKPVTFRYKPEIDSARIPQFGLVAEDVEKVNPDLVARDASGKVYTVRYEAINAMLLNEFLKEHRKVESLEKAMAEQQRENAAMRAMLKEQAAQIQKVSTQLELSKPASQTVKNDN